MNIYNWIFPSLDIAPSADGLTDVVKVVHWRLGASDGTNYTDVYGSQTLSSPNPEDFIAYDNLTPEIVQAWTEASLGADRVAELKTSLDGELARMTNPPIVSQSPPWL